MYSFTTKGRVTIPATLRRKLDIKPGSEVFFREENGAIIMTPSTKHSLRQLPQEGRERLLAEDTEDLAAFRERDKEPNLPLRKVVKDLKRRGRR